MADAEAAGAYAPTNGRQTYYESRGSGRPVFLLHGGVGASEMFGSLTPALAETRRVVAVHLEGHGRTPDGGRPLRFESMADDLAALIRHLGVEQADIMGYSLGAGVAYQAAIRYPKLVRRLVVVSEPVRRDGWYPEVSASMTAMGPEAGAMMAHSPLAALYPDVDWSRLFGRLGELLGRDYDWSDDVSRIEAPTMAIFADADAVRPEHIVEVYRLLGGGRRDAGLDGSGRPTSRLAIVPGRTHYDVLGFSGLASIVTDFLDTASERG